MFRNSHILHIILVWISLVYSVQSQGMDKVKYIPELKARAKIINLSKFRSLFPGQNYSKKTSLLYKEFLHNIDDRSVPYVLEYNDGSRYLIQKSIGKGSLSYVFKAKNLKTQNVSALRIPKNLDATHLFNYWITYHPAFRLKKFPVPKMYHQNKGQFIETEYLDIKFTLRDFLSFPDSYPAEAAEDALKKFDIFYQSTQNFASFIDNKPDNIAFDGKKWYAIDWLGGPTSYDVPGNNKGGLYLNRFFRFKRDHSYTKYLRLKNNQNKRSKIQQAVWDLVSKYEGIQYDKLAQNFYNEIPASLRARSFSEQLNYAKSINSQSPRMNRIASELLLKTNSTAEIFQILETLDLKLDRLAATFFITQWKNLEGSQQFKNIEKMKIMAQKHFPASEVENLIEDLRVFHFQKNCTLSSLIDT